MATISKLYLNKDNEKKKRKEEKEKRRETYGRIIHSVVLLLTVEEKQIT